MTLAEANIVSTNADRALRFRRERIATAALQGLLAGICRITYADVARDAVEHADALIAELETQS